MTKHQLKADGAAFSNSTLTRIDPNSTKGFGVALCSCGTPSEGLPTRAARKAWFAEHKAKHAEREAAEQAQQLRNAATVTDDEPVDEEPSAAEEQPEEQAAGDAPTADEPSSEEAAEEDLIGDTEQAAPAAGKTSFDVEAMKRKITALLRKAEGTDNEAERDAFNAKAEQLMLRLGLNQAELEAAGEGKAERIVQESIRWSNVYAKNMVNFGHAVCGGLGDLNTLQSGRWSDAAIYIIGFESDVKMAVQLIRSLEQQAFAAMKRWQRENRAERKAMPNYDRLVANRSFLAGFASEVADRLRAERKQVHEEASPGAALVLASKQDRVNAAQSEMYPKLGKGHRSGYGAFSSKAASAGRTAGKTADIGNKRVGGKRGELK